MMYRTKKMLMLLAAIAVFIHAHAQSLQDGIKMYYYQRYKTAQRFLAPLTDKDPLANYYFGLCQIGTNNLNGAAATFSKFPSDPANISGEARIAFLKGDTKGGMALAKQAAEKANKKDVMPYRFAADAITYTSGGDYQQAIGWYKMILEKIDEPNVHISLGDVYRGLEGGGGEAMNNYEHVTEKDQKNSLAYSRIGSLWYDARNYPSALDNYNKAKVADSANPLPYKDLANAYWRSNNLDAAYQNIKKYIQLSDSTNEDMMELLSILYLAHHCDEVVQLGQSLINRGVTNPGVYGTIAYCDMDNGDSVGALQYVRQYFSRQDPKKLFATDYINYGKILLKNGLIDSAGYYYSKGVHADTSSNKSDIYRQIAEGFKNNKEYMKSAAWYDTLVKANPNTQPLDYFWRGAMYYYSHDYKDAKSSFDEMATKYADQPSGTYWQGRAAAAIDSEAKTCEAGPYFTKWLQMVGPTYDKKNDLLVAYEYLELCAYNNKNKDDEKKYKDLILKVNPDDNLVKQINDAEKGDKPRKTTTSKGTK
jgi:hypothetical protein